MNVKVYQELTNRTRNRKLAPEIELVNYALGMVCEAGEAGDEIKKYVFHEHGIDKNEVIKELGDTMWYISNICNLLGIELEEVLGRNIAKLEKRYPNGFDAIDSINRVE